MVHTILGDFDLDIDFWPHFLGFSCLEHISYITASFPQMCLMLDQFLWGHLSRFCDISCYFKHGYILPLNLHTLTLLAIDIC